MNESYRSLLQAGNRFFFFQLSVHSISAGVYHFLIKNNTEKMDSKMGMNVRTPNIYTIHINYAPNERLGCILEHGNVFYFFWNYPNGWKTAWSHHRQLSKKIESM